MKIRTLIALTALSLSLPLAAGERPFSVDIMVKAEGVAEAEFSPRGDRLLYEQLGAYDTSQNFAWERVWDRERSTLMDVAMQGDASPQPLSKLAGEHVWLGSYSPDGTKAGVGWFDGDVGKAGVYDFRTGQLHKFDFPLSNATCTFDCPLWLSEDEFVHYSVPPDQQKLQMSRIAYTDDLTHRWAQDSWKGKQVSVKVYGSGVYESKVVDTGGTLLRVDANTGRTTTLGTGLYRQLLLSPDRRLLAAIRETGSLPAAGSEVKAIFDSDKVLELTVHDFSAAGKTISPCGTCNVTRDSLRWSPDGDKLFFAMRVSHEGKQAHEFYVYDFHKAHLERFAPQDVPFEMQEELDWATYIAPFVWLTDDVPAVRITRKAQSPGGKDRNDWYAVPAGAAPVALTTGLAPTSDEKPLQNYVAVHDGKLLMMADGDLWQLSPDGTRRNLTEAIDEPLSPWCSVISYWREAGVRPVCSGFRADSVVRPIDNDALAQGWVTFRVMHNTVPTGDLLFLNVDTGETAKIAKPAVDAELVTASALARTALFHRKGNDGDRLLLASSQGQARELLHFNRQLAGVAGGKAIMLTRREPGEKEDRYDWLLLPPGHKPGDRHPLLVYFYPDTKYSKEWHSDDLRSVSFLNQHIPAAHGFAVLLASMKIADWKQRGDPMLEMHEQLIHAAENVVQQGYADPARWAIMGHSYGGYGTESVITQTDRFKAAVAMDGPSNLTSAYAAGMSTDRALESTSALAFGVMWSEGGQGRMGVAPWQDPERYIRNSPLFHADKITTPLMLVHADDDFVNINEAEQMFNALHRQGKDVEFLRYWGEDHVMRSPANMRDMWGRIFDWFDKYLDISRDAQGDVVLVDHKVKSRGAGEPAR